jgi:hypothetical protein
MLPGSRLVLRKRGVFIIYTLGVWFPLQKKALLMLHATNAVRLYGGEEIRSRDSMYAREGEIMDSYEQQIDRSKMDKDDMSLDSRLLFREKIWKIISGLQRVCHDPGCERIKECPENHQVCKEKLDIQTAMAWMLAGTLIDVMGEGLSYHRFTMRDVQSISFFCVAVMELHRHSPWIRRDVYEEIEDARTFIHYFRIGPMDMIGVY